MCSCKLVIVYFMFNAIDRKMSFGTKNPTIALVHGCHLSRAARWTMLNPVLDLSMDVRPIMKPRLNRLLLPKLACTLPLAIIRDVTRLSLLSFINLRLHDQLLIYLDMPIPTTGTGTHEGFDPMGMAGGSAHGHSTMMSHGGGGGGFPSDGEIERAAQHILQTADLNTVTKREIRRQLEDEFGMDLTARKTMINAVIDKILLSQA